MSKKDLTIDDIGEFGLIESIKDDCHYSLNKLVKGIGDDCAVIGPYERNLFLITTDMLVEDIHFILGKSDPELLGQKAMAVNLSDIAAMGGRPLHGIISMAIPKSMHVTTIHSIYNGMKEMCQRYSFNILGGDMSASPQKLILNVALIGEAPENEVVYRTGAKPGDKIYITDTVGDSAAGLKLITGKVSAPEEIASILMEAHNRPIPSLEAGRIIAESRLAGAMIDLSDGLVSDLRHICDASGVGARLFFDSIPLSEEVRSLAEISNLDPYELGLYGGEDYGLLVTVPAKNSEQFEKLFFEGKPCHISEVGEITVEKGIRMLMADGGEEVLSIRGFDHFL
jgi:thiamine-monophosphate kinase